MSELVNIIKELEAEEVRAQADLEDMLLPYRQNRDAERGHKEIADQMGAPLKQWLMLNDPERLYTEADGGLYAYLERRRVDTGYDMARLAKNNPGLLARLVEVVALTINKTIAEEHGLLDELRPYENPDGLNLALQVRRSRQVKKI